MTEIKTADGVVVVGQVPKDDAELAVLRAALREDISARYPEVGADSDDHLTDGIRFLLVRRGGAAIGCCALQENAGSGVEGLELKRMYVDPAARGSGAADALLDAAQRLAGELGARQIYLETGTRQPEAIRFYERNGFAPIPVYPPFCAETDSLCYAKRLG